MYCTLVLHSGLDSDARHCIEFVHCRGILQRLPKKVYATVLIGTNVLYKYLNVLIG
jgi:hypothetical protein